MLTRTTVLLLLGVTAARAEGPEPVRHQITGLFSKDREEDLRKTFERLPEFELMSVDFDRAEASVRYDAAKVFPGATPEQVVERFDGKLREVSRSTFGVRPLRTKPDDQLTWVEIPVVGLDCKACTFAAYSSVFQLKGVEQAQASFKEGRVRALIDPKLTDRVELEAALKQRGVTLPAP